MVTMMFENSMQLVNPMVSLPYWDFTIEGAVIDTDEEFEGDYTRLAEASPLWTPDWFGGVDKHDYQVGFEMLCGRLCRGRVATVVRPPALYHPRVPCKRCRWRALLRAASCFHHSLN